MPIFFKNWPQIWYQEWKCYPKLPSETFIVSTPRTLVPVSQFLFLLFAHFLMSPITYNCDKCHTIIIQLCKHFWDMKKWGILIFWSVTMGQVSQCPNSYFNFFGTLVPVSHFWMLLLSFFSCHKYFNKVKYLFWDTCHGCMLFATSENEKNGQIGIVGIGTLGHLSQCSISFFWKCLGCTQDTQLMVPNCACINPFQPHSEEKIKKWYFFLKIWTFH